MVQGEENIKHQKRKDLKQKAYQKEDYNEDQEMETCVLFFCLEITIQTELAW